MDYRKDSLITSAHLVVVTWPMTRLLVILSEHGYDKTVGSRGGTSSSQDHSSHFHEDALYVSLLWTNPTACLGAHLITCTEAKKWVETRMNLCTQSWGQNSIAETRNLKQLSTPYSGPCGVQSILGMENWILKK